MSQALVELRIPTKYGVDVYSARIIEHPDFYIKTIKTSGISLELNYQPEISISHTEDDSDVENDTVEEHPKRRKMVDWEHLPIPEIINRYQVDHSHDRIYHFKKCYGNEFNSCDHLKLFEIIENEYEKKYTTTIYQGPIYQKYNELCRKLTVSEKQTEEIYKRLDTDFRNDANNCQAKHRLDEARILIEQDPVANSSLVVGKLEEAMDTYREFYTKQKEKLQKMEEDKQKAKEAELRKDLTIEKNQFGQYIYKKFNFVFDAKTKSIVGVANGMGGYYPLDNQRIQICQQLKLPYHVESQTRV